MSDIHWKEVWKRRLDQLKTSTSFSRPVFSASQSSILVKKIGRWQIKIKSMNRSKLFASLAFLAFISLVSLSLLSGILLVILARELPAPDRIVRREGFATKIYDRNGNLIYDVYENQKRTPVQLYQVPQDLREATVAIEDKDFYKHGGFDPKGYLRAIYYVFRGRRLSGGSTLTQQLIKNVLLTPERTLTRKIKEFVLALEIESKYSKDQILQMYLNEAPYGGSAYGVEEAAHTYFNKSVSELDLAQCAFLAGLPQSPTYYSPSKGDAYLGRTAAVLRRMREDGYITPEEEKAAFEEVKAMKFTPPSGTLKAPHFVEYVKSLLEEKYGEKVVEAGGLRVTTTLDLTLQEKAQQAVTEEIAKVDNDRYHITNGAAIVLNPQTGEILAMVGSKNYDDPHYDGKFNVITAKRQPGSTIKPVTYVTALKKGYTASTLLMDTLTTFPGGNNKDYNPTNYDLKEHGPVQMRYALGNSLNIPAVKMLALVGVKDMLTTAYEMGLTTLEPTEENLSKFGLAVTLGGGEVKPIELAAAYSAFANGGLKVEPVAILKVTDKDGNVLEEFRHLPGKQVLTPEEAFIISNILSDNQARLMTFGENNLLKFTDRQVAAKTGTTNDRKDNWTVGWTPQVIVVTWVGNNDNTSMKALVSGVSGAAPIWRKIITAALNGQPKEDFPVPSGIVTADVDEVSGYRAHDNFPSRTEYFIKGTEPTGDDPVHQKLKLCKSQGKLATPFDIARNDYEEKEFFIFKENDPFNWQGINQWQKGIDDWVAKQGDSRYHPPTEYCDTLNQVNVSLEPSDHAQVSSNFKIKIYPVSAYDITKVEIFVDGESQKILNSPPYEIEVTLPDGTHTLRAEAWDANNNHGAGESRIGVNVPWDWQPSPTPQPTLTPPLATPTH